MNKVFLIGRLGQDPKCTASKNCNSIANLSVATNETRVVNGERVEHSEWHRVVAYGKTAELCEKYLVKGRQVAVEGKLVNRKWQDKEGNDRYTTEVLVDRIEFLGGNGGASGGQSAEQHQQPKRQEPSTQFDNPFITDSVPF